MCLSVYCLLYSILLRKSLENVGYILLHSNWKSICHNNRDGWISGPDFYSPIKLVSGEMASSVPARITFVCSVHSMSNNRWVGFSEMTGMVYTALLCYDVILSEKKLSGTRLGAKLVRIWYWLFDFDVCQLLIINQQELPGRCHVDACYENQSWLLRQLLHVAETIHGILGKL